jgi:hypothetical protein
MIIVVVYVPSPDRAADLPPRIAPGSAIVGPIAEAAEGSAERRIYYEGNEVGASTMATYADRVKVAADALVHHFPTTAQARIPAAELLEVAWFAYESSGLYVLDPPSRVALATWLGFEGGSVPLDELVVTR